VVVADEESDNPAQRGSDYLVEKGYTGDFAITGEPTDLHIGVQAKGVLGLRIEVRGTAAHGSTPWEGDNAIVRAVDVFRTIETLPFAGESSELFPRPSISLGRIIGGDALNKVPDRCVIDVDIRYLPGQDPKTLLQQIEAIPHTDVKTIFHRDPAIVSRRDPFVLMLADSVEEGSSVDRISVGRDGASDAISFLDAGVPAVEFGPTGAGHHGPEEWVSIDSLAQYRRALVEFVERVGDSLASQPGRLEVA
jgi:succinyl-diaminopimelate desuccinylase